MKETPDCLAKLPSKFVPVPTHSDVVRIQQIEDLISEKREPSFEAFVLDRDFPDTAKLCREKWPEWDAWVQKAKDACKARHDAEVAERLEREKVRATGAFEDQVLDQLLKMMKAIGHDLFMRDFDKYKIPSDYVKKDQAAMKDAIKAAKNYASDPEARIRSKTGFVVIGTFGSGKDHLISAIAKRFIISGATMTYTNGSGLWSRLRATMGKKAVETELDVVKQLCATNCLWLADPTLAGKSLTDYQAEILHEIIDRRSRENDKVTWVSINAASDQDAAGMLGGAVWSRVIARSPRVELFLGSDYRERLQCESWTPSEIGEYMHSAIVQARGKDGRPRTHAQWVNISRSRVF